MVSHIPAKFGGHRHGASEDVRFFRLSRHLTRAHDQRVA